MANNLTEKRIKKAESDQEFIRRLKPKQRRFLAEFLSSEEDMPDILSCMKAAGYTSGQNSALIRAGQKLIRRVSNLGQAGFQLLLNQAVSDFSLTRSLAELMNSSNPMVRLQSIKLILELKGYTNQTEQKQPVSIVFNIPGKSEEAEPGPRQVNLNVLPDKSDPSDLTDL